jgi:catechol 2,3-dioxygenase-like lactoylglutathione lyase family enzyme
MVTPRIDRIDHLVLTVANIEASVAFYIQVLGFTPVTLGDGRTALRFGDQKINLHAAERPLRPHALRPTPGSSDLCVISAAPLREVAVHLRTCGIAIVEGPVSRTGAVGAIESVYIRDPDGNLIEIAVYPNVPG